MKQLVLLIPCLFISLLGIGQSIIDLHYAPLEQHKDATVVFVSGNLFGYASQVIPDNEEEELKIKKLLGQIESFQLISVPHLADASRYYKEGLNTVQLTHENLLMVRNDKDNFSFFIKENNEVIEEIVGLGSSDSSFVVFTLACNISNEQLEDITDMIQNNKNIPIRKEQSEAIKQFKVYPNPIASGSEVNVEIPTELIGGYVTFYNLEGKMIHRIEANTARMGIMIDKSLKGPSIIEISKENLTVKKQILVIE